ncbi:hypothetical protein GEV54_RS12240 [Escherichia coli]
MIVITIILYGYKTIGAASYPLSINDAKHPLTILKGCTYHRWHHEYDRCEMVCGDGVLVCAY